MESLTFRQWLAERGYRFNSHDREGRPHGHAVVVVHREERTATLPLLRKHYHLDSRVVEQICAALGLNPAGLPRPRSRA